MVSHGPPPDSRASSGSTVTGWTRPKSADDDRQDFKRRRSGGGGGILSRGLREMNKMVEELEQASEEPQTRQGILGTALEDMKGVTYHKIFRRREETPKRSRSFDDQELSNRVGMIEQLLRDKDPLELKQLGLTELLNPDGDNVPTPGRAVPPLRRSSTHLQIGKNSRIVFVPKQPSRDSLTPPHASGNTLGKPPFRESITSHASSHEEMSADDLAMADPQTKILYFAKRDEWTNVEVEMETIKRSDFSMADNHGFTAFLLAVKAGKDPIVDKMIRKGARVDYITKDGRNATHIAAMYSSVETLELILKRYSELLRKGAGPKKQLAIHVACERKSKKAFPIVKRILEDTDQRMAEDGEGSLPIHLAFKFGNVNIVELLLSGPSDEQTKKADGNGDTLLHLAARSGSLEAVRTAIAAGCDNANVQNLVGRTPLHEVAEVGDQGMLKIMFKLRADANIHDKEDKTPVHVAAERGDTQMVESLIDKFGGSLKARTRDGSTLLHIAACSGHTSTALAFLKRGVPLMMPNKKGALGLHSAAAAGFNEVVKMLISRGTNVDVRTRDNYTALHVAVQSGKASVVETLLGSGADIHVKGGELGQTALHIAASLNGPESRDCAMMLLKSGGQPDVAQMDGETCLHIAARNGNKEIMRYPSEVTVDLNIFLRLLLNENADSQICSKIGETPLQVAAKSCNFEAASMILKHLSEILSPEQLKEHVNHRTVDGFTALHYAAEIEHRQLHFPGEDAKLVNLLIDYGGMVEMPSLNANETAMHMAARSGNQAVLLAMHHARIDVFDEMGRTALHLAAYNGHLSIVHLLLQHKAFVNSKSKTGEAPLHLAAQNGHVKVVNVLVQDHGASLEAITLDNQTALHFAAKFGQLAVSQTLLALGANPNARDDKGQTPLHLAAENDFPDVVKLFLKMRNNNNRGVLTAIDHNGFTCAHIAAMKGSLAVVRELMMIDKPMVIQAKTKTLEATTLHMAAAGGHANIVKILLENGANAEDENSVREMDKKTNLEWFQHGMTALHLGAKNGFISILEAFDKILWKRCSRKTGLNALHIAAFYGNSDFVNEMLKHVQATVRSEPPIYNHHVNKEFSTEYGFTPLHLAAQSGHDSLVRMLLNQGVQVDATSTTMNVIPLHLAAQQGHIAVVGMLLSRSTQQQHAKDWRGRTPLHLAAQNGHYEMVSLLIAQGSNINVMDQNGWTGLHFATRAGHLSVVKLFIDSSADPLAETKEGKVPLCFAAAHNHIECLRFLLKQKHDTHQLMEDRKFIFDLMVCGKTNENEPLQEFILQSPAPIETAVKLSALYRDMSEKEKERAKDLLNVAVFSENMAVELLGITATEYNAALLLKAKDNRGRPLLDVLIENEQKEVVSYASVQRYLTEVWTARVDWSFGKFVAFSLFVLMCPPAWFYFSLPLDSRIGRAPIIKFVCHIVSHVYFTILLTIVVLNITHKMYEVTSVAPNPVEWLLLLWLSGNLVSELSTVGGGSGLGIVKVLILVLSAMAIAVHVLAFLLPAVVLTHLDNDEKLHFARTMLYLKNQLFAFALLFAFVEYLDFLTVHHLFGPWAIIIRTNPRNALFSLFGLVEPDSMPPLHLVPDFAKIILKLLFGIYMMVTLIVLINLLIAMMSDTYQRIQAQSDKEWKFGRAILIRQMNKRSATPSPINMLTKFLIVVRVAWRNRLRCMTRKAQDDLRFEENIDAFSMGGGQQGRASPTMRPDEGAEMGGQQAELGRSADWNIETVIDWRKIVSMYYQANGKLDDGRNLDLDVNAHVIPAIN
uniref:ANK_REP_REGION domain-containing protein n=1 Tax=Caenorhabditis tropicalis TaxID=1561998 RepID=A0A1I7TBT6_9PELO